MMKLIDLFPNWLTGGGIFVLFNNPPWVDDVESSALDVEYFGNRSGEKLIAPLLNKLMIDNQISDDNRQKLVDAIWARFGKNWTKLYTTLKEEYNPIENYNMTEKSTYTDTDTGSLDRSDKVEYGKTVNSTAGQQSTSHDQYYGFNASQAGSGKNTNGTDANISGQGSNTEGGQDTTTGRDTHTYNKSGSTTHTRSGNIGVTTTQQLIESERNLWLWNYFDAVFSDVDTMLVLQVFGFDSCCYEYNGNSGSYTLPVATATTLGGVKLRGASSVANHYAAIDAEGYVKYQYPGLASYSNYGLVRPVNKTGNMSQAVGVDELGQLFTAPGGGEAYTLPPASATNLGGVIIPVGYFDVAADGSLTLNTDKLTSEYMPSVTSTGRVKLVDGQLTVLSADGSNYGVTKPIAATSEMTQAVGVNGEGELFTTPSGGSYTLPVASPTNLGGVKPLAKTTVMTQAVGVDLEGRLYTAPGSGGDSAPFLSQSVHISGGQTITETGVNVDLNIAALSGNWDYVSYDGTSADIADDEQTYVSAVLICSGSANTVVRMGIIDGTNTENPLISGNLVNVANTTTILSVADMPLNLAPGSFRIQVNTDDQLNVTMGAVTLKKRILN